MLRFKRSKDTYLFLVAVGLIVPLIGLSIYHQREAARQAAREMALRRHELSVVAAAAAREQSRTRPLNVSLSSRAAVAKVDVTQLVTKAEAVQVMGEPLLPAQGQPPLPGRSHHGRSSSTFMGKHSYMTVGVLPQANYQYAAFAPVGEYVVKPVEGIGDKAVLLTSREQGTFEAFSGRHSSPRTVIQGPSNTARLRVVKKEVCLDISLRSPGAVPSAATLQALSAVGRLAANRLP